MNILLLNGVNLNLQGKREPATYGYLSFDDFLEKLRKTYPALHLDFLQSNEESVLVENIQQAENKYNGIVLNAGAFTHTSIAVADAIRSVCVPVVEVHITNIYARETYRKKSYLSEVCKGSICGFGLDVYRLAIESFLYECRP
ncbi:MAG: 3-dehydroquinate dehydratase [Bacteroidales bacterium]|jgi:3-dehydroquinate dehydratase-2|nr:3-dehydroquinate dehydratase [Bacteroidales bacterium]